MCVVDTATFASGADRDGACLLVIIEEYAKSIDQKEPKS